MVMTYFLRCNLYLNTRRHVCSADVKVPLLHVYVHSLACNLYSTIDHISNSGYTNLFKPHYQLILIFLKHVDYHTSLRTMHNPVLHNGQCLWRCRTNYDVDDTTSTTILGDIARIRTRWLNGRSMEEY